MSWTKLLRESRAEHHTTSKAEIDDLRKLVTRNLKDAAIDELSNDNRFGVAYEAALILAKMAVACSGYRVKGQGHHKTMFEALPLAMGTTLQTSADYFDQCRRERNSISYDTAGTVSDTEVAEIIREATQLERDVEQWIATVHPGLK